MNPFAPSLYLPSPADTEGEEVTEPTMYRCCFWGHLNLMDAQDGNGIVPTPNFAFLGRRSGECRCLV